MSCLSVLRVRAAGVAGESEARPRKRSIKQARLSLYDIERAGLCSMIDEKSLDDGDEKGEVSRGGRQMIVGDIEKSAKPPHHA